MTTISLVNICHHTELKFFLSHNENFYDLLSATFRYAIQY